MAFSKTRTSISLLLLPLLLSLFASIASAAYPITGATGGVHPRLEIRQLYHTGTQWNLYLIALVQFQGNQQDVQTSWFQIGGIHGSPNIAWDGVEQSSSGVGYCTHGINLFPTWHRPYLALFEGKLQEAAFTQASLWNGSQRTTYMNLASTLRAPYYDWAAAPSNGVTFPLVLSQKYVTVNRPAGQFTIINPLFRYNFHPGPNPAPYGAPWSTWDATLRNPTSNAADATSNEDLTASTLANNRVSQRQSLYNWFTLCTTFDEISNDGAGSSNPQCHISLESLHNNVHVWIGGNGNGHMSIIPVSAHDPTFMLHHAMIDRLFAMWQTLYPNSWITNEASPINTFTIQQGSIQGPASPLTPFHRDTNGDFWTSDAVRQWTIFSYTYPEYADSDGSAAAIRTYINNLYGPNANAFAGSSKKRSIGDPADGVAGNVPRTEPLSILSSGDPLDGIASLPKAVTTANNGSTYQYIANIKSTRWRLGQTYTIYLFFGPPTSEAPASWGTDTKMVGSYGVFSGPDMLMSSATTTSTVPLTDALTKAAAAGALKTLEQSLVISFLQNNLEWRVGLGDGTALDPTDVPDFLISVVSSTMTVPSDPSEFPTWSPFHVLTQITEGKTGGARSVEEVLSTLGKK